MKLYTLTLLAGAVLAFAGCSGKKPSKDSGDKGATFSIDQSKADSAQIDTKDMTLDTAPADSPQFPGGFNAMRAYIKSHIHIPEAARKMNKEGKVIVTAQVDAHGNIADCSVFSSDDAVFNDEAIRVVKSMPQFTPAHKNGKPVATECKIQVMFRLK